MWRIKMALFAAELGQQKGLERPATLDEIKQFLGPKWAYLYREKILQDQVDDSAALRMIVAEMSRQAREVEDKTGATVKASNHKRSQEERS